MFAAVVVSRAGSALGGGGIESRPETPRTEPPLGQNAPVTARADVAERGITVKTVAVTAAPGAYQHAFGYRLAAIGAPEDNRHDRSIAFDKRGPAHFLPVQLFSAGRFQERGELEFPWHGLQQGRAHLLGIGKTLVGIDRQGLFKKSDECQIGPFAESLVTLRRPAEGPFRQNSGDVLVEYESYGETIAAVGGPAVGLLGSDVAGSAEVVDGPHPAFELQADSEIPECGPAVRKKENVAGRNVAVNHPLSVRVGQAVKDLGGDRDDPADAHRFRAVVERPDRKLGRQNRLAADNIGVLNRHNVGMTQLRDQADFSQQGLIVPLAVHVGQRYLQGHPDAFDGIAGLPDLAASPFAEIFCQSVLTKSLPGFEIQARRSGSFAFTLFSRQNHILSTITKANTFLAHILIDIFEINFKKIIDKSNFLI